MNVMKITYGMTVALNGSAFVFQFHEFVPH